MSKSGQNGQRKGQKIWVFSDKVFWIGQDPLPFWPQLFYASSNIAFHISSKINGIMYFFGCFSKPSLTIGVQNLKTIKKPLKTMVWGLKIIKCRWLNDSIDPLKNHRTQWSVIKKVVNGDGQRGAKPSKNHWCQWYSREKNIILHRSHKMTIAHLYSNIKMLSLFTSFQ